MPLKCEGEGGKDGEPPPLPSPPPPHPPLVAAETVAPAVRARADGVDAREGDSPGQRGASLLQRRNLRVPRSVLTSTAAPAPVPAPPARYPRAPFVEEQSTTGASLPWWPKEFPGICATRGGLSIVVGVTASPAGAIGVSALIAAIPMDEDREHFAKVGADVISRTPMELLAVPLACSPSTPLLEPVVLPVPSPPPPLPTEDFPRSRGGSFGDDPSTPALLVRMVCKASPFDVQRRDLQGVRALCY